MKIVVNPKYESLGEFIKELPQTFDDSGETIYRGRNQLKAIEYKGIKLNVKSFRTPNLVNRFIYGNIRKSKARRSFEYANILIDKKINTPDPVAYIEEKSLFSFKRSYYLSIHDNFDGMMREFKWGKLEGREKLLTQFAEFTADMHNKKVLHLDYSPGNILYKKTEDGFSFYLVDLNRMKFGNVSMEKGCENFRRLWGSDQMIAFIAAEYAKARNFDIDKCVGLTLCYHKQFWEKFSKRHKDKQPYVAE